MSSSPTMSALLGAARFTTNDPEMVAAEITRPLPEIRAADGELRVWLASAPMVPIKFPIRACMQ